MRHSDKRLILSPEKLGRAGTGIRRTTVGSAADPLILLEDPRHDTQTPAQPEYIVTAGRVI